MEFPRLVYKGPEQHILVADEDAMNAALQAGWFATVPEALEAKNAPTGGAVPAERIAAKLAEPPLQQEQQQGDQQEQDGNEDTPPAPPTRAELEAQAAELGVVFSPNLGDKKLAERIAAKLADAGA